MGENKRYYWIKLKTDFFNQETIDFLLSQSNGCQYIVLYQMLCLKTANTNGEMATKIGEIIIPYDINKIVRDTKYFDFDTVTIALELFKQLGLVYEEKNQTLKISNFDEMVGSETKSAKSKREYREKLKAGQSLGQLSDNVRDIDRTLSDKSIDIRDKSIDIRDKSIDIRDKSIDIRDKSIDKVGQKAKRFLPPTLDEVREYCSERKNGINPEQFIDYYEARGWELSKGRKMKDWKAAVRTWERNEFGSRKSEADVYESDDISKYEELINSF